MRRRFLLGAARGDYSTSRMVSKVFSQAPATMHLLPLWLPDDHEVEEVHGIATLSNSVASLTKSAVVCNMVSDDGSHES